MEFEKQFKDAKQITVYEKIGNPLSQVALIYRPMSWKKNWNVYLIY
jgi:hypothetical protein